MIIPLAIFFIICLPSRALLLYLAWTYKSPSIKRTNNNKIPEAYYIALFTFIVSCYWIFSVYINFLDLWWNPYKIVHIINYLGYTLLTIFDYPESYILLATDLLLACFIIIFHYYKDLSKSWNKYIYKPLSQYKFNAEFIRNFT